VYSVPGTDGWPPICPDGESVFCCEIAFAMSGTVMPSRAIRSGFSQTLIA
jgi:hypothetical protein